MQPETVTAYSAVVQAVAAVVSLIVAGVLALITYRYMKLTKGILAETSKAREATETSARAAHESVELMRQQLEEQADLGRTVVQAAIATARAAIKHWRAQNITSLANLKALPPTDNLTLTNARAIVDHAARIDGEAARKISAAFDEMSLARSAIESIRDVEIVSGRKIGHFQAAEQEAHKRLDTAYDKLAEVDLALPS